MGSREFKLRVIGGLLAFTINMTVLGIVGYGLHNAKVTGAKDYTAEYINLLALNLGLWFPSPLSLSASMSSGTNTSKGTTHGE